MTDHRPCSCHPIDNPPKPCPKRHALHECRTAALAVGVRTPFIATCRGGIWSVWRVMDDAGRSVRYVTSGYTIAEALNRAKLRRGTPAPLAPDYPLARLRVI